MTKVKEEVKKEVKEEVKETNEVKHFKKENLHREELKDVKFEYVNLDTTSPIRTIFKPDLRTKIATVNPNDLDGISFRIKKKVGNDRYAEITSVEFGVGYICIDPSICKGMTIGAQEFNLKHSTK